MRVSRFPAVLLTLGLLATAPAAGATSIASAADAKAAGGINALVKAAKAEKSLRVIGLAPGWANYGAITKAFTKKYGITVVSVSPDASSGEALSAVRTLKGKATQPDVVELGGAAALQGQREGLFAPYRVTAWKDLPTNAKATDASWYRSFCGAMSIGFDANRVTVAPTTLAGLANSGNRIALGGSPLTSQSALSAIVASGIANGGSVYSPSKGLRLIAGWQRSGLFTGTTATAATVKSGETPIVIDWEYSQRAIAAATAGTAVNWRYLVPSDVALGGCYAQAISKTAPHPAAARLWQEFLFSAEGQNLLLAGGVRPVRMATLTASGAIDKTAAAQLPALPADKAFVVPTVEQYLMAQDTVALGWSLLNQL